MKPRPFSTVLGLVLTLALLAGCSSTPTTTAEPTTADTAVITTTAPLSATIASSAEVITTTYATAQDYIHSLNAEGEWLTYDARDHC